MPTRKAINKGARARGSRAEAMLHKSLTESGYEVRRTHLSAFPAIRNAVRLFSNSAKELNFVHNGSEVLCYLQINDTWLAYKWNGVGTVPVKSVIKEER